MARRSVKKAGCKAGKKRHTYSDPKSGQTKKTRCLPGCRDGWNRWQNPPRCTKTPKIGNAVATRLGSDDAAAEGAARSISEIENRQSSPWLSSTAITLYLEMSHRRYTNKRCIYSTCMWQKEFEQYHESGASPMYNMFFQGFRNRMDKRQHQGAENREGHRFVIVNVSGSRAGSHWVLFGFDTAEAKTIYVWDSLGRGAGKTHA